MPTYAIIHETCLCKEGFACSEQPHDKGHPGSVEHGDGQSGCRKLCLSELAAEEEAHWCYQVLHQAGEHLEGLRDSNLRQFINQESSKPGKGKNTATYKVQRSNPAMGDQSIGLNLRPMKLY